MLSLIDIFGQLINQFLTLGSVFASLFNKLTELARKYKKKPDELPDHLNLLIKQLNELENSFEQREKLELKQKKLTENYFNTANKLRNKRRKTAKIFSDEITNKIHELGMAGKLQIVVVPINTFPSDAMRSLSFAFVWNAR